MLSPDRKGVVTVTKAHIVRTIALAVAIGLAAAGMAAAPVSAETPGRQVERAHAVWALDTDAGPARYEIEARRVTTIEGDQITTGFIGISVCLPQLEGEAQTCIAAADLKRIHDDRLEIDLALSTASFRMTFARKSHSAMWDASGSLPEVAVDRLLEGDAAVERAAEAEGTAFGTSLSAEGIRDAAVQRGSESDQDLPPAPGTALPGFGAPTWSSSGATCWTHRRKERGFARAMNEERADRNLGRLRLDPELSKAARVHTRDMIRSDLLHHTSNAALRRRVTNWAMLGENVGMGTTVGSLHAAFMASPAHKDNILYSSFNYVGIGTATGLGRLWVTVIFESRKDPGTRLRMPRC